METNNVSEINTTICSEEQQSMNNIEINNNQSDKTFNRLRDLQSLLKKESALKELCKKIPNKK